MGATKQQANDNDYAVAKSLNEYATKVINIFSLYQIVVHHPDFDLKEINRVYVLLVNELQKLYERNAELANIKYEPIWKQVDYIHAAYDVQKFLERLYESNESPVKYIKNPSKYIDYHIAEIDRLCIIADKDTPDFSPEQKKLIGLVQVVLDKYNKIVVEEAMKRRADIVSEMSGIEAELVNKPVIPVEQLIDGVLKLVQSLDFADKKSVIRKLVTKIEATKQEVTIWGRIPIPATEQVGYYANDSNGYFTKQLHESNFSKQLSTNLSNDGKVGLNAINRNCWSSKCGQKHPLQRVDG